MSWEVVSAVVQVFGFGGVAWGLLEYRRALQTQVALEFYRRYAEITARMPSELRLAACGDAAWKTLPAETRTRATLALIEYLNLSSEEYGLYRRRRLPKDVWQVTAAEIARNFNRSLWQDGWRAVWNEYASDKPFLEYVDSLVAHSSAPADPAPATSL